MKYGIFLFFSDESATCLNMPVAEVDTIPAEITHDMMVDIVYGLLDADSPTTKEELAVKTIEELSLFMQEEECLTMDSAAIIECEQFTIIEEIGNALLETMENDSSSYKAAEVFGDILTNKAVSVIDFPRYVED